MSYSGNVKNVGKVFLLIVTFLYSLLVFNLQHLRAVFALMFSSLILT